MESKQSWISPKEAAGDLGVSLKTIRRWIESGRLRATQPGKTRTRVRILPSDLEAARNRPAGAA